MLFVEVTQMNTGVYLCNTILVTEIFCYRYSTINNFSKKYYFSMKFGSRFRYLLGIKCAKRYSYLFTFDIFIAQSLGGPFFTGDSIVYSTYLVHLIITHG